MGFHSDAGFSIELGEVGVPFVRVVDVVSPRVLHGDFLPDYHDA